MLRSRLPVIAALLLTLAGTPSAEAQEERLIHQVEQLIAGQRGIRIYDWVGFSVRGNTVTLEGLVSRPSLKDSIERSVGALEAVEAVRNEIEVLPSSGDDVGIRINAYWRIYGHPEIRRYLQRDESFRPRLRRGARDRQRVLLRPIHIVVKDGHLVLEGELEQQREKRVAEEQANAVLGTQIPGVRLNAFSSRWTRWRRRATLKENAGAISSASAASSGVKSRLLSCGCPAYSPSTAARWT